MTDRATATLGTFFSRDTETWNAETFSNHSSATTASSMSVKFLADQLEPADRTPTRKPDRTADREVMFFFFARHVCLLKLRRRPERRECCHVTASEAAQRAPTPARWAASLAGGPHRGSLHGRGPRYFLRLRRALSRSQVSTGGHADERGAARCGGRVCLGDVATTQAPPDHWNLLSTRRPKLWSRSVAAAALPSIIDRLPEPPASEAAPRQAKAALQGWRHANAACASEARQPK